MVKRRITRRKQKGGNVLTFVGKALNYSNLNTWPGVINHGGNHYAYNEYPVDLQTGDIKSEGDTLFKENLMSGGYTYKNNKNFVSSSKRKSSKRKKIMSGGYTYKNNKNSFHSSKRKSSKRKYKGGNFPLLGDLRTSSQVVENSLVNTQHILQGKPTFVSPLAWKDQYI
jgi:hypothetical protein